MVDAAPLKCDLAADADTENNSNRPENCTTVEGKEKFGCSAV